MTLGDAYLPLTYSNVFSRPVTWEGACRAAMGVSLDVWDKCFRVSFEQRTQVLLVLSATPPIDVAGNYDRSISRGLGGGAQELGCLAGGC